MGDAHSDVPCTAVQHCLVSSARVSAIKGEPENDRVKKKLRIVSPGFLEELLKRRTLKH